MGATSNKFLRVNRGVILTPIIEPVIVALDPYFEAAGITANVTSGLRDEASQLSIIRGYLAKTGLDAKYKKAMTCGIDEMKMIGFKSAYKWQEGWSALLNAGIIVNPPKDAECLMDYIGSDGKNRKGTIIKASAHYKGTCFDIGGGTDGIEGVTGNELAVCQKAVSDKVPGIVSIVVERKNNCIHFNCIFVKPTTPTTTLNA